MKLELPAAGGDYEIRDGRLVPASEPTPEPASEPTPDASTIDISSARKRRVDRLSPAIDEE